MIFLKESTEVAFKIRSSSHLVVECNQKTKHKEFHWLFNAVVTQSQISALINQLLEHGIHISTKQ